MVALCGLTINSGEHGGAVLYTTLTRMSITADQCQSTLDFTNNCSFIPYVSPSPASEPETVAPGATIHQQLEALIDQLYWWHYSKPYAAVYDKASDSLIQILCTAPNGWLPFHEQTSIVECFQVGIFNVTGPSEVSSNQETLLSQSLTSLREMSFAAPFHNGC